jgi:hypothetical protein
MKLKAGLVLALTLAVAGAAAQDMGAGRGRGMGQGQGMGGGQGMMAMMSGRGLMGTVAEVAADHLILKTYMGESYLIHIGVNTRCMKAPAGAAGGGRGEGMRRREGGQQPGMGGGMAGMTEIKASDIKKGDDVAVMGEIDPVKKEAGAMNVVLVDPARAQAMKEMMAGYGKTWVMGKVTAIDGVKLTVMGGMDNQPHVIVADENTTLRKRREPVTLADIQVGDTVRADGAVKGGNFAATAIQVMGMPQGGAGRIPRDGPPAQ